MDQWLKYYVAHEFMVWSDKWEIKLFIKCTFVFVKYFYKSLSKVEIFIWR